MSDSRDGDGSLPGVDSPVRMGTTAAASPSAQELPSWDLGTGGGFRGASSGDNSGSNHPRRRARVGNKAEATEISAAVEAIFEAAWTSVPLLRALAPARRAELNAAMDALLSSRDWSGAGALLMGVPPISLDHDTPPSQHPSRIRAPTPS